MKNQHKKVPKNCIADFGCEYILKAHKKCLTKGDEENVIAGMEIFNDLVCNFSVLCFVQSFLCNIFYFFLFYTETCHHKIETACHKRFYGNLSAPLITRIIGFHKVDFTALLTIKKITDTIH